MSLILLKRGFIFVYAVIAANLLCGMSGKKPAIENSRISFSVKPWYKYHKDGSPGREIVVYFQNITAVQQGKILLSCEGKITEEAILLSSQQSDSLSILLPTGIGLKQTKASIDIYIGKERHTRTIDIPAKKQWTVYIYPHSHVDIGYTNLQDVVEKLHERNIDVAIDIANKTKNYPEGSRFVWNPEATWVVDNYLKNANAQQMASFVEAVRKGWIQIDAAYANINTSTCSDEELLRMFHSSSRIHALTGVPITTMVQIDNPGGAWGMVQAAAAYGVRGFFSFPNYFDLRHRWENRPFYWKSQDGQSKIFYLQATSYGYGFRAKGRIYGLGKIQALSPDYDRLSTADPLANFIDPFIFDETARLEQQNSPYDIFAMTWSMADNCLIDADLPEAVKLWNENYAYPKLIISGTKEILAAYESKYKTVIPTYSGDMSEFWTQGLGSDAKSVGIGRVGKETLVQAETLWPMLNKTAQAPIAQYNTAWENALLSAEHTWGYQDPRAPLAAQVEANKANYFIQTEIQGRKLIDSAIHTIRNKHENGFAVINTLSWSRDAIVTLSALQSRTGNQVLDDKNKPVPSQRLTTGELVFEAKDIPALGSRFYKLLPGRSSTGRRMVDGHTLQNELISVHVDEKTGNIKSFVDLKTKRQVVDTTSFFGLNSYNYLPGVRNGSTSSPIGKITNASDISIKVKENGPLVASLLITSKAESCNWLTREVKIFKNQRYLELVNTLDKIATQKKEGIHYGFAFNVPQGEIKMDIPLGVMTPEKDQLPYTNKNWFTFQRWIDVSNKDFGVTWTSIESPIVEFGNITGTILDGARLSSQWIKAVEPTQTIISWPINNHWDTNFPLQQGGIIKASYFFLPHEGGFDPVLANQFGMGRHRPLIVAETDRNPIKQPLFKMNNPLIILSQMKKSDDNKAVIVKIRSLSSQPERVSFTWSNTVPRALYACGPNEQAQQRQDGTITILPYGLRSLRIEF